MTRYIPISLSCTLHLVLINKCLHAWTNMVIIIDIIPGDRQGVSIVILSISTLMLACSSRHGRALFWTHLNRERDFSWCPSSSVVSLISAFSPLNSERSSFQTLRDTTNIQFQVKVLHSNVYFCKNTFHHQTLLNIIITDALTCQQHFNVTVRWGGADKSFHTGFKILICKVNSDKCNAVKSTRFPSWRQQTSKRLHEMESSTELISALLVFLLWLIY